jgi:uncharacterized glyoxalase superfamily metalloenzyme YdcJ
LAQPTGKDNLTHQLHRRRCFSAFPGEMFLRRQELAYFRYRLTPAAKRTARRSSGRRSAAAD